MSTPETETQKFIDNLNQVKQDWFAFLANMRQILTRLNERVGEMENQADKQPGDDSGDRNQDTAGEPSLDQLMGVGKLIEEWYERVSPPKLTPHSTDPASGIMWHEDEAYQINFKTGMAEKLDIAVPPAALLRDLLHYFNDRLADRDADPQTLGSIDVEGTPDDIAVQVTKFRSEDGRYLITFPNNLLSHWTPYDHQLSLKAKLSPDRYEAVVHDISTGRDHHERSG